MKLSYLLILSFLLTLSFTAHSGKIRVIESPTYEVKRTGLYNISKIELGASETRLHVHITFIPHWWVKFSGEEILHDPENNKDYKVKAIEGTSFGEQLWMPDSGEATVVLVFPALEKGTRKIDYKDEIFGISLEKKRAGKPMSKSIPDSVSVWLDQQLTDVHPEKLTDFSSDNFFQAGTGKLIGYIKGYDVRLGFTTGIIYTSNEFTREDYPTVVQIFPDGRFEAALDLMHPAHSMVIFNRQRIPFYLEPGQTLAMILDWEEFLIADRMRNAPYAFRQIEYKGELATRNTGLVKFEQPPIDYRGFSNKVKTLTPDQFRTELNADKENRINLLHEYVRSNNIPSETAEILKNNILLQYATRLFDFADNRKYEYNQDSTNAVLKLPLPANYFDFLQKIPLNNNSLLISGDFDVFVNRFEYCDPFQAANRLGHRIVKPEKSFIAFVEEENLDMSEEDKAIYRMLDKPEKTPADLAYINENLDEINALGQKYSEYFAAYNKKWVEPLFAKDRVQTELDRWEAKDSILIHNLQLENSQVYEITKIRSLRFYFDFLGKEQSHQFWASLRAGIQRPYLREIGDKLLMKMFPEEVVAYTLPEGTATNVFKEIIDDHKGKVLFVDFWATTCGPCVATIKHMKPVREKHKDSSDIEFIFITDEKSSPEGNYSRFIQEQDMTHTFRLKEDHFNYLRQLFKFNGIPRYVVVDKDGNVIDDDFQMHNFEYELSKLSLD